MSNFAFLAAQWPHLHQDASKAESLAHADPRTACFYSRRVLELAVIWLYKHDQSLKLPYQDNLNALLHAPGFQQTLGTALFTKTKLIKELGNLAVHSTAKIAHKDALAALRELFHVCYWLARTYGQKNRPDPGQQFVAPPAQPGDASQLKQTLAQLQALETTLRQKDEKLAELLAENQSLDQQLQQVRQAIAAQKKANQTTQDTHDYTEAQTRDYFIDLLLKEAGWHIDPAIHCEVAVAGMPTKTGKGHVDYVLWGDDGKPLALVEAKKTKKDPLNGLQQAKLYANCLEQQHGQRPIIFCSNGYQHWLWDDTRYAKREVQGFYKKDELELMIQRRSSLKKLADAPINPAIVERYYQTRAVRRIGEAFEREHQRKALVVMATGAGKTRTVIALADLLMNCNWAKRILFLADRVALVRQAVKAFKTHLPDCAPVNLVTEKQTEGRVYACTYPTMMGLIDASAGNQRRFGPGHFDLIVIDEAHRSVYQKYAAIFNYFDALLVGLTATPKEDIAHDTYGLFDLESGVPTDAYNLGQAVDDGFLVPMRPLSVPLKFQREGIKYADLSQEEKDRWDTIEWNEDGTTPVAVESHDLNQWLFNQDTIDKALAHVMTHGHKVAGGDRLGKTIVFAKNNAHAKFIAERFDVNYPEFKSQFASVITYQVSFVESLIEDFGKKDKAPHMAVSVDMLDTGIDVPEVLNLVFFKIVRSKTKFWQMVGRGTRLCKDVFGPGQDKKEFVIFDFCQNLEFFGANPPTQEGVPGASLSARLFTTRLDVLGALDSKLALPVPPVQADERPYVRASAPKAIADEVGLPYAAQVQGHTTAQTAGELTAPLDEPQLRGELARLLCNTVAGMNLASFVVRPQRKTVEKFAQPQAWASLQPDDLHTLAHDLADLPSSVRDEDEEAKRFDLLMLRAQLRVLQGAHDLGALRERAQAIMLALAAQEAIPDIAAHIVLIHEIAGDEWWQDVTLPMLELARKRLRSLIRLIEKTKRRVVYTDFEDDIGEHTQVNLPSTGADMDLGKFKDKARQFLRSHQDHLSLQRLRRNLALTPADLKELEQMLLLAGGSPQLIAQAKQQSQSLGVFIRSLVGLEREAAKAALSQFISGNAASANQIEFIDLIVEHLTENGTMSPERLYESPFTDINPQGPEGVFPLATVDRLVGVLAEIRQRAAA